MAKTIIDVAREANVSKSTVSLVLNNSPHISDAKRKAVLAAMEKIGYVPNTTARGLIKSRTYNLGVIECTVIPHISTYDFGHEANTFAHDVTDGILAGLVDTNYGLLSAYWSPSEEKPWILRRRCVDGVFLIGTAQMDTLISAASQMGLPVVVVGPQMEQENNVFTDYGAGSVLGLRYLLGKGHKRILCLNSPAGYGTAEIRKKAVAEFCEHQGLLEGTVTLVSPQSNSGEGGRAAVKSVWDSNGPFDAVIANDIMGLGALRFFYERHISVPDDVSVLSFDDSFLCSYASPALTAVNLNRELSGRLAADMMLRMVSEKKSHGEKTVISVPIGIVPRESVKDRRTVR